MRTSTAIILSILIIVLSALLVWYFLTIIFTGIPVSRIESLTNSDRYHASNT